MPMEPLSMRKIREVMRLRYEQHCNHRDIARSVKCSASTVSTYLQRAKAAGLSWPLPEALDDEQLYARLFPPLEAVPARPLPNCQQLHQALKRKGVTLLLLWYEYREQQPNGIGYSRFCELYHEFAGQLHPTLRLTHVAGDKLFVDYAGLTVPWVEASTGEIKQADIFVAVLGASNYTYVQASTSQSLADWIEAHVNAFTFFGGVPNTLVPDNLKSGISQAHYYDPDINPTYQDLANHYGVAVIPARVATPKDKAKVEVGVQGIERWLLAPLRHHTFFSVAEINAALKPLLQAYNARAFQQLPGSRYSQYLELDRPALKPLPTTAYQYATWKKAKAGIDYHVAIDKHYYSIPYQYLKKVIQVRISTKTIECFYQGQRIALHARQFKSGHTTLVEHMPPHHQAYVQWTPQRLMAWAKQIGSQTEALIQAVIESRPVPQQAYRACLGILRLAKHYGNERLESAAKRALAIGAIRYKHIESILKKGLDKIPLAQSSTSPSLGHHANVRGAEYYH